MALNIWSIKFALHRKLEAATTGVPLVQQLQGTVLLLNFYLEKESGYQPQVGDWKFTAILTLRIKQIKRLRAQA